MKRWKGGTERTPSLRLSPARHGKGRVEETDRKGPGLDPRRGSDAAPFDGSTVLALDSAGGPEAEASPNAASERRSAPP